MKKYAVILIILSLSILFSIPVYAQTCADIEYAELKDMSQESFMQEHCRIINQLRSNFDTWTQTNNERYWRETQSCSKVAEKTSRVYLERFKTPIDNKCGREK